MGAGPGSRERVEGYDAVFVRLEPPVDPEYLAATHVLDLVDRVLLPLLQRP